MSWKWIVTIIYVFALVVVCLRIIYETRSTTKSMAYLLFCLFVPVVGVAFYLVFGINYWRKKLYDKKMALDEKILAKLKKDISHYTEESLQKAAWLRGAGRVIIVDTLQYRLDMAKKAANAEGLLWEGSNDKDVIEQIRAATEGRGADVCIEAVGFEPDRSFIDRAKAVINLEKGSPKVLEACMSAVRRGGIVSVLGVYPTTYDNFPIGQLFDKGIRMQGGQAPAHKHIDKLLEYVKEEKVKLDDIITHRLPLIKIADGYSMFKKKEDNCVKVVLDPWAA